MMIMMRDVLRNKNETHLYSVELIFFANAKFLKQTDIFSIKYNNEI